MTQPITKDALMAMTKEQLVELLELAIKGQRLATENTLTAVTGLAEANKRLKELEDQNKTLEAENLLLKARP